MFGPVLHFLGQVTAEQIALFSILITLIIFLLSKNYELKMKKHQFKKLRYEKYMALHLNLFRKIRDKKNVEGLEEAFSFSVRSFYLAKRLSR